MLIGEPIAKTRFFSGDKINCQPFPASRRQCRNNGAELFYGNLLENFSRNLRNFDLSQWFWKFMLAPCRCGFMFDVSVELNLIQRPHMHVALILIENHKLLPMGLKWLFSPVKFSLFFRWCEEKRLFRATLLGDSSARKKKDKSN